MMRSISVGSISDRNRAQKAKKNSVPSYGQINNGRDKCHKSNLDSNPVTVLIKNCI